MHLNRILIGIVMTLCGCSSMNSAFDCPNKAGITCQSLDQINAMVDKGQLPKSQQYDFPIQESALTARKNSYQNPNQANRTPDSTARIWISSFEDSEGNLHEAHYLQTVVTPSHW